MRANCIVVAVLMLSVSAFAINDLSESFNGAFDLATWDVSGSGTFGGTTYDFAGAVDTNIEQGYTAIGNGGSWVMKTVWTGIANDETKAGAQLNHNVYLDGPSGGDFRMNVTQNQGQGATLAPQVDGGTGGFQSIGDIQLGATLPSSLTTWMELNVYGPQDWQMDYYYDSGSGKTFIGSFYDEDLTNNDFDPTMNSFKAQLTSYFAGSDTSALTRFKRTWSPPENSSGCR